MIRLARPALLLLTLAVVPPLQGQTEAKAPPDTALERRVREVASILRCPVCLNLSIQDSPSELAKDMREVVRDRLRSGQSEQQVTDYFIARYGEWVLMKPPAHGVSLLVWVLPGVVVLGGGALVVVAVRRWMRNSAAPVAAIEDLPEEDLRKVRQELAKERRRLVD
ncbi:MAG: cytochrome c-type biogenesis protein CcmH [Gemmatimonadetes bacterium]|nr:cytochrome c-type biogenesis protein CcmH [Gemmatimonadota bacterium]